MKKLGLLITFEGGEGGGKTTQLASLKARLSKMGKEVVALREPGGTVISEQIREVVLSAKNTGIAFTTEVLLFQAARAQIYQEIVLPSLKAGKIVLMDRSRDSSVVYQGIVRNFGVKLIDQLNNISTDNTHPQRTYLLDVSVTTGLDRKIAKEEINRMEMESIDFHEKVRQAYLAVAAKNEGKRWLVIDASQSLEKVETEIWQDVSQLLGISD